MVYEVDHSAPDEPQNLSVEDSQGVAVLLWDAPKDADLDHYVLWRAVKDAGDMTPDSELVYEKLGQLDKTRTRYEDNTVSEGKTAFYILSSVDDLGNASPLLHPVSVVIGKDTKAPEVTELKPENGSIGWTVTLSATAKDNKKVQRIRLSYRAEEVEEWTEITDVNAYAISYEEGTNYTTAASYGTVNYYWNLPSLEAGTYLVRAVAVDSSGNESEGYIRRYTVNQDQPKAPVITKTNVGSTYVQLIWDEPENTNILRYIIWMKGGIYSGFQSVGVSEQALGFTKDGLIPDSTYSFYVCALSETGVLGDPSETVTVTTKKDTTIPVIRSVGPESGYVSDMLELSATVEDNDRVGRLLWSWSADGEAYTELPAPEVASVIPASIGNFGTTGERKEYRYSLDLSDRELFKEGPLFIKTEAWDESGNKAAGTNGDIVVEYRIDRTAPAKPENFLAEAAEGYIALSWDQGQEEDLAKYRIWRSEGAYGRKQLLVEKNILNYYDTSVRPGQIYQYSIEAVDQAGNISEATGPVSATALEDTVAPVIHGVSPTEGSRVGAAAELTVAITDNAGLGKVSVEYRNTDGNDWVSLKNWQLSGTSSLSRLPLDLSELDETEYRFRILAEDAAGNQSEPYYISYTIDKTAPTGSLSATGGHFVVDLDLSHKKGSGLEELLQGAGIEGGAPGTGVAEDDFAYYEIYRAPLSDARTELAFYQKAKQITKTVSSSYQDKTVSPHVAYRYAAKVYDLYGNWSWTGISDAIADSIDVEAPEISVTKRKRRRSP